MQTRRWKPIEMLKIADARGNLSVIEGGVHIPFEVARVYYIYDVPSGSTRAGHAHRQLRQLFLALSGSFSLHLEDGRDKETLLLNRPHTGILVEPGVWREINNFSGGAVCMVLASHRYDESDYIRNYDDFMIYAAQRTTTI